jgi:hypothetical protein
MRQLSRTAGIVAAVVLVATVTLTAAVPANAALPHGPSPSPSPTAAGGTAGGPTLAPGDDGKRSWSIRPATADGKPDNRQHFTLQSAAGGTLKDQVLVTNLSKVAATFDVYATDAFNTPTGAFDLLSASAKPIDIGSWVSFASPTVTIPAGGTVAVPFTIAVPKKASPGDHAGGVVVSLSTGTNVRLDTRVAVRMYLRVPGYLRPVLAVQDVKAEYHGVGNPFGSGRVTITYTVVNTGNIRLRSHPSAKVTAWYAATLGTVTSADLPELLPGQRMTLSTEVGDVFPAGALFVDVNLQPYPDPTQPVGQKVNVAVGSTQIWAFSGWLVFLILLALLVVGYLVWNRLRRRRQRRDAAEAAALREAREARKAARKPALAKARTGGGADGGGDADNGGDADSGGDE